MTADIRRYPDLVDLYLLVGTHGDFGDLRNVAAMVEMARDAERRARRQLAFAPTGLLRDKLEYRSHTSRDSGPVCLRREARLQVPPPALRARAPMPSNSSRSASGSLPAAWATSSMKD